MNSDELREEYKKEWENHLEELHNQLKADESGDGSELLKELADEGLESLKKSVNADFEEKKLIYLLQAMRYKCMIEEEKCIDQLIMLVELVLEFGECTTFDGEPFDLRRFAKRYFKTDKQMKFFDKLVALKGILAENKRLLDSNGRLIDIGQASLDKYEDEKEQRRKTEIEKEVLAKLAKDCFEDSKILERARQMSEVSVKEAVALVERYTGEKISERTIQRWDKGNPNDPLYPGRKNKLRFVEWLGNARWKMNIKEQTVNMGEEEMSRKRRKF